jgi:hypothetical protein
MTRRRLGCWAASTTTAILIFAVAGCSTSSTTSNEKCADAPARADIAIVLKRTVDAGEMTAFIQHHLDLTKPGPNGIDLVELGTDYEARAIYIYVADPIDTEQRQAAARRYRKLTAVQSVRFGVVPSRNASGPAGAESCAE